MGLFRTPYSHSPRTMKQRHRNANRFVLLQPVHATAPLFDRRLDQEPLVAQSQTGR